MNKLFEAKRELYHQILSIPQDKITDDEAQLGFILMRDPEIQGHLQKGIDAEKANAGHIECDERWHKITCTHCGTTETLPGSLKYDTVMAFTGLHTHCPKPLGEPK